MVRPAIHPGKVLADEVQGRGMSADGLARELGVATIQITQLLNGKRAITAETALRLGRWSGTGPEPWLNLQRQFELRLAEQHADP